MHDALLESHIVDLIGPQHFYDSVRAAKKGLKPDGLPVVLDWAKLRRVSCLRRSSRAVTPVQGDSAAQGSSVAA